MRGAFLFLLKHGEYWTASIGLKSHRFTLSPYNGPEGHIRKLRQVNMTSESPFPFFLPIMCIFADPMTVRFRFGGKPFPFRFVDIPYRPDPGLYGEFTVNGNSIRLK